MLLTAVLINFVNESSTSCTPLANVSASLRVLPCCNFSVCRCVRSNAAVTLVDDGDALLQTIRLADARQAAELQHGHKLYAHMMHVKQALKSARVQVLRTSMVRPTSSAFVSFLIVLYCLHPCAVRVLFAT